ncbi:hypothetical protein Tco_0151504 [Tanacetum coccineum]
MAALQYKDDHNRIAYLGREKGSEDFGDILSYVDHSPLRYALTHDPPVVFDSLVKQFWATAVVRPNAAGSHDLVATIDGRAVVVTESLIRTQLRFEDANGIVAMPNSDILEGMRVIGYPTDRALTFLKHHLSPQWRFLVHTLLHCLSPKSGSWNQFPSSIATALICLSTGREYNFSRFILEGMIANVKATKNKFLMYPRFLQMIVAIETADRTPRPTFGFTRKLFSNMKFKWEGEEIPLTPPMLAIAAAGDAAEDNAAAHEAAGSSAEAHPGPLSPRFPLLGNSHRRGSLRQNGPGPLILLTLTLGNPGIFVPIRPDTYREAEDLIIHGSDTTHDRFHGGSHWWANAAHTPHSDVTGRAEDPTLLTSLSAKLDRCLGRIDSLETELGTSKKIMGGAILTLGLSRMASEALGHDQPVVPSEDIEEREEEEVPLRRKRSAHRRARTEFHTSAFAQFHAPLSTDVLPQADISESAGPSVGADKGKAPMPDLEIPAEFLAEDAQARQRSELVQILLARELLGADVTEANFIERMTAIKERKKRALADLRYRALKGKPLKQSEVKQMMRNLVKNQWCAAHNGTITMTAVKAMTNQQLIEEYEYICRRLEKDRLLSAQYNLFRPKPVITERRLNKTRGVN